MKVILSSFAFDVSPYEASSTDEYGVPLLPLEALVYASRFYRMPPVHFGTFGPSFVPDYAALLLFEQFVVDTGTLDSIERNPLYAEFADLLRTLDHARRLEIVDFRSIVKPHEETIRAAVNYDLEMLPHWAPAFERLFESWSRLISVVGESGRDEGVLGLLREYRWSMLPDVMSLTARSLRDPSIKGAEWYVERYARNLARAYLHHVSSTLCLSDVLGAPVHEWADMESLYLQKLAVSARPPSMPQNEMGGARKLFDLMFPDFRFRSPDDFLEALEDKRTESLRQLIRQATEQGTVIDNDFVTRMMVEIVGSEHQLQRKRSIYVWLTLPLGIVPWAGGVLQRGAEEIVARMLEERVRRKYGWFLMISEIPTQSISSEH